MSPRVRSFQVLFSGIALGCALVGCVDAESDAPTLHSAAETGVDGSEVARQGSGPVMSTRPVISGTPTVGSTLTASTGVWSGTAPLTYAFRWRRCDPSGAGCANIAGATSSTYRPTGEDALHTLKVRVTATDASGSTKAASARVAVTFPAGTICNASGTTWNPPAQLEHVIVILMENRDASAVAGSANAPYFNDLRGQCGSSSSYLDNLFPSDINSLSHYLALTSGSNCNSGLGTNGSGCVTDDAGPSSHRLTTPSIFTQVTWRAYQEDMPSNCNTGNPASGTRYYVKHNPPPYYTSVTDCGTEDVGIARVACGSTRNTPCGAPSNAFTRDLANDTLAEFSFVTPDIDNDMHDGTVTAGDNWLLTYLPLVFASPAYLRGGTAVYVLWDEQGSFSSGAIPNLVVSPFVRPTSSTATMNHFAALRAIEDQLGVAHLGCAGGTAPGGGSCPTGSTADLRALFGF